MLVNCLQVPCGGYGCFEMGGLHSIRFQLFQTKYRSYTITFSASRWGKSVFLNLKEVFGRYLFSLLIPVHVFVYVIFRQKKIHHCFQLALSYYSLLLSKYLIPILVQQPVWEGILYSKGYGWAHFFSPPPPPPTLYLSVRPFPHPYTFFWFKPPPPLHIYRLCPLPPHI